MQSQIVTLKDEVALMRNELRDQAADLKDVVTAAREKATAARGEVEALKARLDVYDQERLYSYSANLLTHMLKKLQESDKGNVDKGDNNPEHSTTKYANIATHMDRKIFQKKTNLSGSCFDLLK